MPSITVLIADLSAATDQMQQAALADDWAMVEKIQKRRVVLVERIVEQARQATLTEEERLRLNDVRLREARITARASDRQRTLGNVLEQIKTGTRTPRKNRMQKAYDALNRS